MKAANLEEFLTDWDNKNNGIAPETSTLPARLEILMYQMLAQGQPVSAEDLAAAADVPIEIVSVVFQQGKALGGEWDDQGRLLGNVLSLIPTRHQFMVNETELYTWCSLDAMHLPGLLNRTAEVESTDPLSGEKIHLTIPPDGMPIYHPDGTVLSINLSGGARSGPQSPLCVQMQFFASHETAQIWVKNHPDVVIMTVEEVYHLVRERVISPLETVLQQLE